MKYRSYIVVAFASALLVTLLHLYGCNPQSTKPLNQPKVTTNQPLEQEKVSTQKANANVKIYNFKFEPTTLKINVGETVKFANSDEEPHTVTATDGSFDSKALDTEEAWTHTFTKPGAFPYICAIHPFMKGTVTVTSAGGNERKNET
ncbi:MAG: cupredoxin family copper-binding protein [Aulosira sp. ZfuVER01]|nr:cupredoxin family copper-binding protein [Aulosira sp. ZfuVER01]MDZ8000167.1 cupredoxin family copper-binding protein [Aulosira sp. DedVER01a]MDZ8055675.1 cupredoxin family copper-binding protein [Aulosira sp. ZfuCHP01]